MRPIVGVVVESVAVVAALVSCAEGAKNAPLGAGGGAPAADAGEPDVAFSFDGGGACAGAQTCASAKASCGPIGDGCGGVLDCGACAPPETCGGGGKPSVCGGDAGCVPRTCAALGVTCGPAGDGCGGLLHCGTCAAPDTCGGGGTPGACGHEAACVPATCAALGVGCGPAGDGCGNLLDCGTCVAPATCGGGGSPGVCGGANACVPRTCAAAGADCGPVADGCGGLLQCGACAAPAICGGGGTPSVCGPAADAGACTNLCLQQVACDGGATTTLTGFVYAPNGTDPLYDALVYVPNAPVAPFTPGVSCDQCGAQASGSPLVSTRSVSDGSFMLENVPAGQDIPLVIQIGRWRRQVVIPSVAACANTPLPASLTRLPRNRSEGDIPLMAIATGSVDALECVLRKIGVDDAEFTLPASQGGKGRVNLYVSNGAGLGPSTPAASQLWASLASLSRYDMVLFPCEGTELAKPSAAQQALIQYANAGGRVFATHYSYVWLYDDAPFSGTATFDVNQSPLPDLTGYLDTSFPKGQAFAFWLLTVNASTSWARIPLQTVRHDVSGLVAPSQRWIYADPSVIADAPMHYTFNTPVGAPEASQCGRVLFDDFHVEDAVTTGLTFPMECAVGPMTPQEKVLEFMLFDLSSCIAPDQPPPAPVCTPRTCAQQGASCGQAGDGCGGVLSCGSCPAGQTCGGGGTPSVCGGMPCQPRSCADQGIACGPAGDGCGDLLDCGKCPAGETCGGGGKAGVCGGGPCAPSTCADQGVACGPAGDGCGGSLDCGKCPAGRTCGGGGTPGVCGAPACTPRTCAEAGASCGPVADGCGGLLTCGVCTPPARCGGGGRPSQCGGAAAN